MRLRLLVLVPHHWSYEFDNYQKKVVRLLARETLPAGLEEAAQGQLVNEYTPSPGAPVSSPLPRPGPPGASGLVGPALFLSLCSSSTPYAYRSTRPFRGRPR
ncbi:hypothetical protein [Hymenobacter sp. BT491]|uniref:hypothetical protein n=1 Tax=Hymenobacter sp. BT491 TaxID=2766779 RepID=UPI0016535B4D|nr:hypothetical protein [Hymenobacter sp. BT491]MBC6992490.1 hypothetical protein [Hymenobacter sp. BT491]